MKFNIPQPCHENWEEMTPEAQGRFCGACSQIVIDFSEMTDEEVLAIFLKKNKKACGRFKPSQLENPPMPPIESSIFHNPLRVFAIALLISFQLVLFAPEKAMAQGEVIVHLDKAEKKRNHLRGMVKDSLQQPLPFAKVSIVGFNLETHTDIDGYFEIPFKKKKNVLVEIQYFGYEALIVPYLAGYEEIMALEMKVASPPPEIRIVGIMAPPNYNYDQKKKIKKKEKH